MDEKRGPRKGLKNLFYNVFPGMEARWLMLMHPGWCSHHSQLWWWSGDVASETQTLVMQTAVVIIIMSVKSEAYEAILNLGLPHNHLGICLKCIILISTFRDSIAASPGFTEGVSMLSSILADSNAVGSCRNTGISSNISRRKDQDLAPYALGALGQMAGSQEWPPSRGG